jgi:hypothetical protein
MGRNQHNHAARRHYTMNRHTKIKAVIWLPLLVGLTALCIAVGLKAYRESVSVIDEQASPKYYALVTYRPAPKPSVANDEHPPVVDDCLADVLNGPATLARGWRWESDKRQCIGFAMPDDWQVTYSDNGVSAIKLGEQNGEWVSMGIGVGRSGFAGGCDLMPGLMWTLLESGWISPSGRNVYLDFRMTDGVMTSGEFKELTVQVEKSLRAN